MLRSKKVQNKADRDSFIGFKQNELSKILNYEPGLKTDEDFIYFGRCCKMSLFYPGMLYKQVKEGKLINR